MTALLTIFVAIQNQALIGERPNMSGDAEVVLNRRWAESAFAEAPGTSLGDRLAIVHEDVAGDTKVGRSAASV